MQTNQLTGEVSFDLAGKPFRLHATMGRLADYQAAIGLPGLGTLQQMLVHSDARAIYYGLRCLCSSGNAELLDDMLLTPHLGGAREAILAALTAGLPEPTGKKRKAAKAS